MRFSWRRAAGIAAVAFCIGSAGYSSGHPLHVRYDQPAVSLPLVEHTQPTGYIQLDAYDANGGGGTGGSGKSIRAPARVRAYRWAERQGGKWYCWGGTGPSCFDCSGLAYEAYLHQGVNIGRTTYEMLNNRHLVQVPARDARRGMLAFYGPGHVELVSQPLWHRTFGAHETGQRIGSIKWNAYWHPTMFFKVRIR